MERSFRVQSVQNLHRLDLCAGLSLSGGKKEPNQLFSIVLSGRTAGPQSPFGFYSFCPHPAYVIMTLQKHPAFGKKSCCFNSLKTEIIRDNTFFLNDVQDQPG